MWAVFFLTILQKSFNEPKGNKSTFKHCLRWNLSFIDLFCIMLLLDEFPLLFKKCNAVLNTLGQSGVLSGTNGRNTVHCICCSVLRTWQCSEMLLGYQSHYSLKGSVCTEGCTWKSTCVCPSNPAEIDSNEPWSLVL